MTGDRKQAESPDTPDGSHKAGSIILRTQLAGGRQISSGQSSGQPSEAGPTVSAGIVRGNATPMLSPVDAPLLLTTSGPSAGFRRWPTIGRTGVFSCRRCNENKGNGWPEPGYVDPCADVVTERPERYFGYDAKTGEIIPKRGLVGDARLKAVRTINDLGLNKLDVQHYRFYHTQRFINDFRKLPVSDRQDFIALYH